MKALGKAAAVGVAGSVAKAGAKKALTALKRKAMSALKRKAKGTARSGLKKTTQALDGWISRR